MLAAHLTVGDATVGSSKRGSELALAELFNEPVVALPDIDCDPWQSVSLGHIHRRQQMGERCWYVGSPDRLDFSDESLDKAFSLIRLDDDGSVGQVEAVPTTARRFRTITVAEGAPVAETIEAELGVMNAPELCVVKVVLPAGADLSLEAEARRVLEAIGVSAPRVSVPPAPRAARDDRVAASEDIGPIDGLELWIKTQEIPENTATRLREKASILIEQAL
jgi:DNA repair exonuclease SbcCD nuclease subunit